MENSSGNGRSYVRKAAALRYRAGTDAAPRIVAKGRGEIAAKIIEEATLHGVPLYEDAGLVTALVHMELGEAIPPELYQVVAHVLVYIQRLERSGGDASP